jgi:predicted transcriptional regulator
MYKANVNCSVLDECLGFLINQALVEKRVFSRNRVVFVVTQKGISVVKYFRELKQVLPIVDENKNQAGIPTTRHLGSQFYR